MSRRKKLNILIPLVILMFFGAYARHRYMLKEYLVVGSLQEKYLDETSGIAASGISKDLYYIHNDSGDTSRFFAIYPNGGKMGATIYYKGDPKAPLGAVDCEDIAVGPGPLAGKSYVYVGDIGDNDAVRPYITIYRLEENTAWATDSVQHAPAVALHLKYPDGPKDAETLMIDPIEKLIYVVSKRKDSIGVYTTPLAYKKDDTLLLTKRCKLHFAGYRPFKWITAGDISKDGQQILLKSYVKVYYWQRKNNEPVWQTLKRQPQELPYKMERQGEGIGFNPEGTGYYTVSEGVFTPIYYYSVPGK